MPFTHPSSVPPPAGERLRRSLLAGQQYEMLADLQAILNELSELRFRTPTPEGWIVTQNGLPNPGGGRFVYVFHPIYGVRFAAYIEAEWEDKKLWVDDWHGDMQFTRPRLGWASRMADGNIAMLDPQPTYFFPTPTPPS